VAGQGVAPSTHRYNRHGLLVAPSIIQHAIRYARNQVGTPYVWGGSAPGGFDCSGLVYWAYRRAGYTGIGRTTYDQIKQGIPVSAAHLRPGDVVFPTTHHEGLYIGNGMVLEAPHTGDHVKVIPLSDFGFMTARRLIAGGNGITPPRGIGGQNGAGLPVPHPNPQMRMPDFSGIMSRLAASQAASQKQMTQQLAAQQQQFLKAQQSLAAQTRQQQLAQQAQQQIASARTAQQGLSAGMPGVVSSDPATALAQQRKTRLDDLRDQALRRAGIGV